RVSLAEQGIRHDLVAAVFAKGLDDDIVRLFARVEALKGFLAEDDGANLLVAYRRAANIVRIEEKRDGTSFEGAVDSALLAQPEETALVAVLDEFGHKAAGKLGDEDFVGAGAELAGLRGPVDAFFAAVTVNADDAALRVNRLRLLARIRATLDQLADLSKIEG
ncbi:MAG: DALR anticodon-binding domain-containing protein, partial [Ferrovibrionaceae bacterium]